MSPAGRKSEGKVRVTLTLDPGIEIEARRRDPNLNFSRWINEAAWKALKVPKSRRDISGTRGAKEGKSA